MIQQPREETYVLEEKVIASWKYKKGALDSKTRSATWQAHADILTVWTNDGS